jgi:hypothetical protein
MKRKVRMLLSAFLIAGITLFIIFMLSQGKKREVKNLVITYNAVLQRAYLELNPTFMEKLTSERELQKIDNYIAYLFKNKKMFKGELKSIEFMDIKVQDEGAAVVTVEHWVWSFVDPSSKKLVSEVFDTQYGNTYYLKKIQGHWVVDNLVSNEIGRTRG